jgi:hypothetical protein
MISFILKHATGKYPLYNIDILPATSDENTILTFYLSLLDSKLIFSIVSDLSLESIDSKLFKCVSKSKALFTDSLVFTDCHHKAVIGEAKSTILVAKIS